MAPELLAQAVADALNAPAPHHTTPWRFVHVRGAVRTRLLDAMADQWRRDLTEIDGYSPDSVRRRLARGDVPTITGAAASLRRSCGRGARLP